MIVIPLHFPTLIFPSPLKAQLDEQLSGLQMLVAARHSKLEESIKLHQYIHESDDVLSWITERQQTAASDEFGKDFEHVLVSCVSESVTYDKESVTSIIILLA